MKPVAIALVILALSACSKESEQPRAELGATSGGATPTPGSSSGLSEPSPSSFGSTPAPSPSAETPEERASGSTNVSPPQGCDDAVVVAYDCWTAKFPRDISGKSDVECRFTMTCCGTVVSDWKRQYPQSAGPSGVVAHESQKLTAKCRSDLPRLGDVDGDGVPNTSDDSPFDAGTARPF